jgi:hypothetical protein
MPKKTFRIPRADRPPEPFDLVFEIREQEKYNAGTEEEPNWQERDIEPPRWAETIRTFNAEMKPFPGGLVMDATTPPRDDTDMKGAARQGNAVRRLLQLAVVETEEFEALLNDERTRVPMGSLSEIVGWVVEESSANPTNGPARS